MQRCRGIPTFCQVCTLLPGLHPSARFAPFCQGVPPALILRWNERPGGDIVTVPDSSGSAAQETAPVKKIAVLPALLTLGNGICGFVAITYASKIGMLTPGDADPARSDEFNFVWAGWFILFAMLFDMLDGYVARLSRTASKFGGELDSIANRMNQPAQ